MHFTRPLLEGRFSPVLFVLASIAGPATVASCARTDDDLERRAGTTDGGSDTFADASDAAPSVAVRDAAAFDGGPLPIVCTSPPCATALVTTRGASAFDPAEGFCALLHDRTVACWGAAAAGQLGRGDDAGVSDSATAARVIGLQDVVSLDHTCALDSAGAVYCWGTGPHLRDPLAATTREATPVKLAIAPAKTVAVGATVGCALVDNGVVCWGSNARGQIAPLESAPFSAVLEPRRVDVPPGAAIRALVVGDASFAIRTDGTVVTWGGNPPLGRESSLFPDPYPFPAALTGITSIDLAVNNACTATGGVGYCWGATLPDPSAPWVTVHPLEHARPAAVPTPEPIVQIATTPVTQRSNTRRWCAVSATGDVWCWGYNEGGQAGDGTKDFKANAVKVSGLPGPAAEVRTTTEATCALLTSGKIHCWGSNYYGQLGNGRLREPNASPQEVVLP